MTGEVDFVPGLKVTLAVQHPQWHAVGVGFYGDPELFLLVCIEEAGESVRVKAGVFADLYSGSCAYTFDRCKRRGQRLQAVHVRVRHSEDV